AHVGWLRLFRRVAECVAPSAFEQRLCPRRLRTCRQQCVFCARGSRGRQILRALHARKSLRTRAVLDWTLPFRTSNQTSRLNCVSSSRVRKYVFNLMHSVTASRDL